ncbi:MAG: hypothetical protein JW904_13925 [Spirochaetales bacterium]|nr:hypothetical protein [Spirochaetales bacterium]
MNPVTYIFHHLRWLIRGVQVFALVGRSGTGKSFRAMLLAEKYNIELLVDDGLLIRDQKIIAGKSAKKEKAYLGAIKTALFNDDAHARQVKSALKNEDFKSILIIGTSVGMVERISRRLDLPQPHRIINIEDIATEQEIDQAMNARKTEGKHIIPVPAFEVKQNYPHLIYETIKIFLEKRFFRKNQQNVFEKTVVRPEFSKRGSLSISESALSQMVIHCVREYDSVLQIEKVVVKKDVKSYILEIHLKVTFGTKLTNAIPALQNYIIDSIENFTGISLSKVDIIIAKVDT